MKGLATKTRAGVREPAKNAVASRDRHQKLWLQAEDHSWQCTVAGGQGEPTSVSSCPQMGKTSPRAGKEPRHAAWRASALPLGPGAGQSVGLRAQQRSRWDQGPFRWKL